MNAHPVHSRSHAFAFGKGDLFRALMPVLAGFLMWPVLLQALQGLGLLPGPREVQGFDEALMRHRFDTMTSGPPAEILIIGDSSSAIDVEAPLLSSLLPGQSRVLNQGLFMGVDMAIYGEAAGGYILHHPGRVKLVILLVTAEQLSNTRMSPYHKNLWQSFHETPDNGERGRLETWLGLNRARETLVIRAVPFAVHGQHGRFYGYPVHLEHHLPAHDGSIYDRGWYNRPGRADTRDWRINPDRAREAAALRRAIPPGVRLAFGITPLPDGYVGPEFKAQRDAMMREFNESLGADLLLTNLPARFPNGYCSSTVHLNERGQIAFTRALAHELTLAGMEPR